MQDKILWMGEEYGELIHAFKHGKPGEIADETIDVIFFAVSILEILGVNGDILFDMKMKKNMEREPVIDGEIQHFDKEGG